MTLHTPSDRTFEERIPPIPKEGDLQPVIEDHVKDQEERQESALRSKVQKVGDYLKKA